MSVSQLTAKAQLPYDNQNFQSYVLTPPSSLTSRALSRNVSPFSLTITTSAESSSPPPQLPTWASISVDDLPASIQNASLHASKYDFRLGPRDPDKTAPTSWLDQDATGTYNPASKQDPWLKPPIPSSSKLKRSRLQQPFKYGEYPAKRPKAFTWQQGRYEGKRLIITFTFTSNQSIASLKAYGKSLDNWPRYTFILVDDEADWKLPRNSREPVPGNKNFLPETYDLRDRSDISACYQEIGNDDTSVENVTLGHPAARGCKACFELGQPCPLLGEGTRYPCLICREDDIECELIIEPPVKGRCTACAKRKVVCSFLDDERARGPCEPCKDSCLKCVAGPKNGRTRVGPSLDAGYATEGQKELNRSFVSCFQCRTAKKWCSLQSKRHDIPCNRCCHSGISCTFDPVDRHNIDSRSTRLRSPAVSTSINDVALSFPTTKSPEAPRSATKTIVTKLAHPVIFNYQPADHESTPCHWCEDLVYGLLGLGEVQVEVLDHNDGQGYFEVKDGHTAKGYPPSRMCDICTLQRIMVAACRRHELEPIEGVDPKDFDFGIVTDYMMPGRASSAPFQWCSVCPSPAFYRCYKKMDLCLIEEEVNEGFWGGNGCGLLLCDYCALNLVDRHDGNLEALIDWMKAERADDRFALRADVEFLQSGGEILRRMNID